MDLQKKLNDIFAEIDTAKDSIKKMEEEHKANIEAKTKKIKEDLEILQQMLIDNRLLTSKTTFRWNGHDEKGLLIKLPYIASYKKLALMVEGQVYVQFENEYGIELKCAENKDSYLSSVRFDAPETYEQILYDWDQKKLFDYLKNQILQMAIDAATETLNKTMKTSANLQEKLKKDKALL